MPAEDKVLVGTGTDKLRFDDDRLVSEAVGAPLIRSGKRFIKVILNSPGLGKSGRATDACRGAEQN